MDEVIFRTSQRIEALQVQMSLAAQNGKVLFNQYSNDAKTAATQIWNSPKGVYVQDTFREIWLLVVEFSEMAREEFLNIINPHILVHRISRFLNQKGSKQCLYFGCCGFLIGGVVGFYIASSMKGPSDRYPLMKAVICSSYTGPDGVHVEDVCAPAVKEADDIVVQVKAASVQIIDIKITKGYGRNIRKCLNRYFHQVRSEFPVILGRECAGIITEIGPKVTKFEIGDVVWLYAPFWYPGTISKYVLTKENHVGAKPKQLGFEGASSLPYSGSLALNALKKAGLTKESAKGKRVFIQNSCSPVGCVLTQILKSWEAFIIATVNDVKAATVAKAMGSSDTIVLAEASKNNTPSQEQNHVTIEKSFEISETSNSIISLLHQQLDMREKFDFIFFNEECGDLTEHELRKYVKDSDQDRIISTLHPKLYSDDFGFLLGFLFSNWMRIKCITQNIFSSQLSNFGEPHINHLALDYLSTLVETGKLQSVVDHVYKPDDIELALAHRQSPDSIGSTIIKFG